MQAPLGMHYVEQTVRMLAYRTQRTRESKWRGRTDHRTSSVVARGGSTSYRGRYEVGWACHISAQDRLKMRFSGRTKRFRVRTKSQSAVQHIIHVTRYSLRLSRPVRPHSDSTRTRAARTRQSQCAKRTEPESAAHLAGLVIGLSPSHPARFGGLRLASGPASSAPTGAATCTSLSYVSDSIAAGIRDGAKSNVSCTARQSRSAVQRAPANTTGRRADGRCIPHHLADVWIRYECLCHPPRDCGRSGTLAV
jgi:hypothetical protein